LTITNQTIWGISPAV